MESARVRYLVADVDAAIEFYTRYLDFHVEMRPERGFAALARDNLELLINAPDSGGAGRALPDGSRPQPGGWNRVQIPVRDLPQTYADLRAEGVSFRSAPIEGRGGWQVLLEDPSGNPIELFEPKRTLSKRVTPIPSGYHTVTPFFVVEDVAALVEFTERAFGATVHKRMQSDDGVVRHATVRIGDSLLMFSSGTELYSPRPASLHLYVEDVDAMFTRARDAGAAPLEAPENQFYGDRRAGVRDRWDNHWWLATHVEELTADELKTREREFRRARNI